MSTQTTPTSAELMRQSNELRAQAQEIMRRERPEVIARVREAIAHYGLSAGELGLDGGRAGKVSAKIAPADEVTDGRKNSAKASAKSAGKKQLTARRTAAVSYRDGQGNSWSGFGPKPRWLKDALANGVKEESLRA